MRALICRYLHALVNVHERGVVWEFHFYLIILGGENMFFIDGVSGVIRTSSYPCYHELKKNYTLVINAVDGGTPSISVRNVLIHF